MRKMLLVSLGFVSAAALLACSSSDNSDGGPPSQGCGDLSAVPAPAAPISFKNDLMPIFGLSCIASSCHDKNAAKAGLVLGDLTACTNPMGCFDSSAKWGYTFSGPLDPALLSQVYGNLYNVASKTAPAVLRVKPGDPQNSFLMDKISNTQDSKGLTCQNTSPTTGGGPCGTFMPQSAGADLCDDSPAKGIAIAQWILAGAPNN